MVPSLISPAFYPCENSLPASPRRGKISVIASDLSASGAGRWQGAVRPFLLSQALQKLGYEVEILGFVEAAVAPPFSTNVPVKTLVGGWYPQFLRSARQLMDQLDGDVIYAYKPKPSSFGIALLHKLMTKRPVILDIDDWELSWHGGDDWQYQGSWRQRARDFLKPNGALRNPDHPLYLRWAEKWVNRADAVTLHTQFLQNRFNGFYVPNGKDIEHFDPQYYRAEASREKYGLQGYRVLMFPGAPRPYKGLEDVLVALEQLNQLDMRLVIVGGSPYDDYDSTLLQRWGQWIVKLPKQDYSRMPEVVAAADVIVVPQRDTPAAQAQFPLKLTDGMAMAKPVLATRVGDVPDILGNTGYLVEPHAPDQIAAALTWIFDHPEEACAKGQRARQRCIEHYSIEAMASRLSPLLEAVMR